MAVNRGDIVATDIGNSIAAINDVSMPPECCIFKTPIILRRLNEEAYVPDAFSIGPFHHGDPKLRDTQRIKTKYLQGLISRSLIPEQMLRDLIDSVMEVENEARKCYAGPMDYEPNDFVRILVIDGCFIIELLRKYCYKDLREKDDPIFTMSCMQQFLFHDLILLENQVPWMVLQRLFDRSHWTLNPERTEPLIELAKCYFGPIYSFSGDTDFTSIKDIKHIPGLFRKWAIDTLAKVESQPIPSATSLDETLSPIPSATSLDEAGIKFRKGTSQSILDIKFDKGKGVLEIPPLLIQETTETAFRNLISFEQCYPDCEHRFTSYAKFIDNLINSAKDVEILGKEKILENWLNPEEAAPFFNKLYHNTCVKKYYYESLSRELNTYYGQRWPRWRAGLVRNYFNTPWAILSTTAAVILLILSFLQAWYTIT